MQKNSCTPKLKTKTHKFIYSPLSNISKILDLGACGESLNFGLLLLENSINSGSDYLWKRPESFHFKPSVSAGAAQQSRSSAEQQLREVPGFGLHAKSFWFLH